MNTAHATPNPFLLMTNPQSVLAAVAGSPRLAGLHSRVFRPLDKPLIAHAGEDGAEADHRGEDDTGDDES